MRILVVEADPQLQINLCTILSNHNFIVDVATDSEVAWGLLNSVIYDLVLLNAIAPTLDGLSLCHRLRNVGNPVLILLMLPAPGVGDRGFAHASPHIQALESGADGYLTQPIDERELLAHLQALARRGVQRASAILSWGPICLNLTARQVTYQGKVLPINRKEYQFLELFLSHPRQTFSREDLGDRLWTFDEQLPTDATVKTHIRNLRRKLEQAGAQDFIQTHYGHGYGLNAAYAFSAETAHYQSPQPGAVIDTVTAHVWQELMAANARLQQEIEQRRQIEDQLRCSERRFHNAQQVAQIGCWEFDMLTQTTYWTEELYRIHGLDPTQPAPTEEEILALIHPDDRHIHEAAIRLPILRGKPFETNLRIIRRDGEIRYINARGGAIVDELGQIVKLAGTTFDITQWVLGDTFRDLRTALAKSHV